MASEGRTNEQIGTALGITRQKAGRWRDRFAADGMAGILRDKPGRGRKPVITTAQKEARRSQDYRAEWLKFLKLIDARTPPDKELHLIIDDYATHKHPKVQAWLKRHPRFHIHFTPTSASWINMIYWYEFVFLD